MDRIVSSTWRLKRALKIEKAAMEWEYSREMESEFNMNYVSKEQTQREAYRAMIASEYIEKISRYETTIEKQIYKALHELIRLQSTRSGEKPPILIAVDVDVTTES